MFFYLYVERVQRISIAPRTTPWSLHIMEANYIFFKEITIMAWGRSQLQYLLPCNTPNYPLHAATAGGIPAPAFTVPKVNSVAS